ncbi:transcription repressor NadR [Sulfoacidibacillus thermotolerans]|uniref:Transcription repressor NadR n=1 Tax=Sulfoacidibacillus thermotolerans TaxID=1765684 RepID=A0A2U3D8L6_SULT2|nr:transcription repressor NadR [Sulfoacidibacillus thermotolerans]PWI57615.1 hypothetical protein BM613_07405 [Sulfoacidibacillus thermotolerans]
MERRDELIRILQASEVPLTGAELAQRFGVTRQVIVQDIAVLRAKGYAIVATPQGYFQPKAHPHHLSERVFRSITIVHTPEQTEQELLTFVDAGVEVLDVSVDHPIYGEFVASLMFGSRRDVLRFTKAVRDQHAPLLLSLTGGVHRHTLAAKEEVMIDEALHELKHAGFRILDDH